MNQKVKMKPSYLKIAFLDRDGTLIKDYPDEKWREIKEPEFLEGSIEGLKRLKEMGYDFIIITNQYLINDGIISLNDYQQFTGKFLKKLKEENNINITVINPKFLTGLDTELLEKLKESHSLVITLEDGELMGGYGQNIASYYGTDKMLVKNYGISKKFHTDFNADELLDENGMSVTKLSNEIINYVNKIGD